MTEDRFPLQADLWTLWVDGTALPNPGKIGVGYVLRAPDGHASSQSIPLGRNGCNNEAEMYALCHGLEAAQEAGARRLTVISDSDFVVRHGRGEMQTRVLRLQSLLRAAGKLMAGFESVTLQWVPRHRNQEADLLARSALGLPAKPVPQPKRRPGKRFRNK
ncbi:MAG: ribonuclease HI family protein [Rhodocyclaceae bacterium]|nr:MAG: ribonuclease HI family protein [Rhodocyclaceae bacterium]